MDAASQQKLFQLSLACELVAKDEEEIHYVPSRRTYVTTRRLFAAAHQHVNAIRALAALKARRLEGQLEKPPVACMPADEVDRFGEALASLG